MADVSITSATLVSTSTMSRRLPLTNLPNAPNSPRAGVTAVKRSRAQSSIQHDSQALGPLAKRPMLNPYPPSNKVSPKARPGPVKSLLVPQERIPQQDKAALAAKEENAAKIQQWRQHYRKVFPEYVFYFDNIPTETRARCSKQIAALGAKEAVFFSTEVTHVVTTRAIPSRDDALSQVAASNQPLYINPLVLERHDGPHYQQSMLSNSRFNVQAMQVRKPGTQYDGFDADQDSRKLSRKGDILAKAQEYGQKVWTFEKFHRMMATMFDTTSSTSVGFKSAHISRSQREGDLTDLLKNERLNGPLDRDRTVATKDLVSFKGYYIYLRDSSGIHKAIMVKDFPKVANKEEGEWPQFRSVSGGKCPFIVEDDDELRMRRMAKAARKADAREQLAAKRAGQNTIRLSGSKNAGNSLAEPSKFAQPVVPVSKISSASMDSHSARFPLNTTTGNTHEPLASGLQRSHITSAIRSQMISSTADAPGGRSGTTKEMFDLQRKVLERRPSSVRMTSGLSRTSKGGATLEELRGGTKRKIDEVLHEECEFDIHEDDSKASLSRSDSSSKRAAVVIKKQLKPGYCENCKLKFRDFDEHIDSKEHQKFAITASNWRSLDAVLVKLKRPQKQVHSQQYHYDTNSNVDSSSDPFI